MAVRNFDQKFGAEFLESLPGSPGVYLVYDHRDELIYVGKAKNLKRRLSQYRNTLRRKKHYRMRGIVKEAARIEIRCAETHLDACLTEAMLIQTHRPRWNIVGAYSFLYPLIGIRSANQFFQLVRGLEQDVGGIFALGSHPTIGHGLQQVAEEWVDLLCIPAQQ